MGLINPPDPDFASTATSEGAALVGIADAGSYYTGTTVEAALQEAGAGIEARVQWASKQITHADLTAAATSEAIDFDSALPTGAEVIACFISIATLFSGGSVSDLDVDVGVSGGDVDAFVDGAPAFTGDPTGRVYGTRGVWATGSAKTPTVTFLATGDNVVNLTAGDLTAYVVYSVIDP